MFYNNPVECPIEIKWLKAGTEAIMDQSSVDIVPSKESHFQLQKLLY